MIVSVVLEGAMNDSDRHLKVVIKRALFIYLFVFISWQARFLHLKVVRRTCFKVRAVLFGRLDR